MAERGDLRAARKKIGRIASASRSAASCAWSGAPCTSKGSTPSMAHRCSTSSRTFASSVRAERCANPSGWTSSCGGIFRCEESLAGRVESSASAFFGARLAGRLGHRVEHPAGDEAIGAVVHALFEVSRSRSSVIRSRFHAFWHSFITRRRPLQRCGSFSRKTWMVRRTFTRVGQSRKALGLSFPDTGLKSK